MVESARGDSISHGCSLQLLGVLSHHHQAASDIAEKMVCAALSTWAVAVVKAKVDRQLSSAFHDHAKPVLQLRVSSTMGELSFLVRLTIHPSHRVAHIRRL